MLSWGTLIEASSYIFMCRSLSTSFHTKLKALQDCKTSTLSVLKCRSCSRGRLEHLANPGYFSACDSRVPPFIDIWQSGLGEQVSVNTVLSRLFCKRDMRHGSLRSLHLIPSLEVNQCWCPSRAFESNQYCTQGFVLYGLSVNELASWSAQGTITRSFVTAITRA